MINSILTKLIIIIAVVEFLIMAVLYEYFEPLHLLIEKYAFLGPIIDTVILVLIVTVVYFKMLKQPMDKLLRVMEAVEKKDFSMKADEKRKDELGAIAKHFNRVNEKMKNWNNDLEIQVEEQTRQSREINKELVLTNEELHTSTNNLHKANEELIKLKADLEKKTAEVAEELVKTKEQLKEKISEAEVLKNRIVVLEGCNRSNNS